MVNQAKVHAEFTERRFFHSSSICRSSLTTAIKLFTKRHKTVSFSAQMTAECSVQLRLSGY